jgi:hypothetical protein
MPTQKDLLDTTQIIIYIMQNIGWIMGRNYEKKYLLDLLHNIIVCIWWLRFCV